MIDKAAILTGLFERNRIRREAKLPLIDIRAEYEHGIERAKDEEYAEKIALLRVERERLEAKYIARVRRRRRDNWTPGNWIERMRMGTHVQNVLRRIHRMRTGEVEPHYEPRNLVRYGSGRDDPTSDD